MTRSWCYREIRPRVASVYWAFLRRSCFRSCPLLRLSDFPSIGFCDSTIGSVFSNCVICPVSMLYCAKTDVFFLFFTTAISYFFSRQLSCLVSHVQSIVVELKHFSKLSDDVIKSLLSAEYNLDMCFEYFIDWYSSFLYNCWPYAIFICFGMTIL